jgi:hypothetical protein
VKGKVSVLKFTAACLSLALIQVSFGPEAWAQVVPRVGGIVAPVGSSSAAGTRNTGGTTILSAVAPPSLSLLSSSPLAAPSAPAFTPSLPASAIAAAAPAAALSAAPAFAASVPEAGDAVSNPSAPSSAAETAAGARLESGPSTAGVSARMARRVAELKNFFTGRRDDGVEPGASDPAATQGMLRRYIMASNGSTAGYELLSSASMPNYLDQTFHKMSMMADLSIAGSFSGIIGRQLSPLIVNSMPLKRAYVGALGAAFIAAMAIGLLANIHVLTVPALFGLMIVFRFTQAGAATAERTVIPSVLGKDQVAMGRLRGTKQSWAEVASVLTQNGAAALVVLLGTATKNLIIAPFFYLAAIGLLWSSLKIPKSSDEARLTAWRKQAAESGGGRVSSVFKNFARQIAKGYKLVMHDPAMRASALITMLMILFNVMTYSILGPAFGKYAVAAMGPSAAGTSAAPIMGLIVGLFSFGGLFAGKIVTKQSRDIESRHEDDPAAAQEAARSSAMKWMKYGALSFLAVGAMALPLPIIGPLIVLGSHTALVVTAVLGAGTILSMWRPKLGPALAMAPVALAFPSHVVLAAAAFFVFGFMQVVASLKNDTLFDRLVQEKAPADYANAAAFVGAASMFSGMLGLTALKFLIYGALPFGIPSPVPAFTGLHGVWPFVAIFGGLAVPAALLMYSFTRRLNALTSPDSARKN